MLDLQQIKQEYPEPLQVYERAIVREYLQYKILQAIFESAQASKLSFLGGTALRIVHGNSRFSEDIDLDNFGLSWQAFGELIQKVKLFLELEGFLVETSMVAKDAFHCDLRFPKLLYEQGLSPHQQEKILIQLDTVAQGSKTRPDFGFINQKMGIASPEGLREELLLRIEAFDFDALADDVAPFLIAKEQVKRVVKFREFWKQVDLD